MSQESAAQNFKTTCLRLFIASILATAFVGAGTLLLDLDGWWRTVQERVLATCAILNGASFWGLICGWCYSCGYRKFPTASMLLIAIVSCTSILLVWELISESLFGRLIGTGAILAVASFSGYLNRACYTAGRNVIPVLGCVFTAIATVTGVLLVWELLEIDPFLDGYWPFKLLAVAITMAVGCTHLSMLLLMKLKRSYQWVHGVAYYVVLGLAALVSALFLTEGAGIDEAFIVRIIGVWSIAATAVTLIIPVLWFLSRGAIDEDGDTAEELQRRIAKKCEELAALEERLAALPPAIGSPWDVQEATQADSTSVAASAGESLVGGSRHG